MVDQAVHAATSSVIPKSGGEDGPENYRLINDADISKVSQILRSKGDRDSSRRPRIREDPDGPSGNFILASAGATSILKTSLENLKGRKIYRDNRHRTLLHMATKAQRENTVAMLLDFGQHTSANLQCKDVQDRTPLHYAAALPSTSMLQLLLSQQHTPTMKQDSDGYTPLCLAVRKDSSLTSVRLLIRKDWNAVNVRSRSGETPLLHACKKDSLWQLALALLLEGADIHSAAEPSGNTPLHTAASHKSANIVRLLFDKGADIEAENYANQTPFQLAASRGDLQMLKLLLDRGASTKTRRDYHYVEMISAAIRYGPAADGECRSAELECAFADGDLTAVHILVACGFKICTRDDTRPLNQERCKNVEEDNSQGVPPLLAAVINYRECRKDLIDIRTPLEIWNKIESTTLSVGAFQENA